MLHLYGAVGYLRDLEFMHDEGHKPRSASYRLVLAGAETQACRARRAVVNFILDHDVLFEDAYRALRHSRDPLISGLAAELKQRRHRSA